MYYPTDKQMGKIRTPSSQTQNTISPAEMAEIDKAVGVAGNVIKTLDKGINSVTDVLSTSDARVKNFLDRNKLATTAIAAAYGASAIADLLKKADNAVSSKKKPNAKKEDEEDQNDDSGRFL